LAATGKERLTNEVQNALEKASTIIVCLSKGDLKRCSDFEDDFFAFELKIALELADKGIPIVVLMHKIPTVAAVLTKPVVDGMDSLHNGLGSKLRDRLQNFRRYYLDLGIPDDNFDSILDGICVKQ